MKASVASGLLLLVVSAWTCSGQQPVLVECTRFHLRVIAKRALFYPDELVGPDELFLGPGCQASEVRPDELEFRSSSNLCGITMQIFCDRTVFHTWLTYIPRNNSMAAGLSLECLIPSDYIWDGYSQLSARCPSPQYWFLKLRRYCAYCDSAHFQDDWSTVFYGPRNSYRGLF